MQQYGARLVCLEVSLAMQPCHTVATKDAGVSCSVHHVQTQALWLMYMRGTWPISNFSYKLGTVHCVRVAEICYIGDLESGTV